MATKYEAECAETAHRSRTDHATAATMSEGGVAAKHLTSVQTEAHDLVWSTTLHTRCFLEAVRRGGSGRYSLTDRHYAGKAIGPINRVGISNLIRSELERPADDQRVEIGAAAIQVRVNPCSLCEPLLFIVGNRCCSCQPLLFFVPTAAVLCANRYCS
jgi:hypothetical protein